MHFFHRSRQNLLHAGVKRPPRRHDFSNASRCSALLRGFLAERLTGSKQRRGQSGRPDADGGGIRLMTEVYTTSVSKSTLDECPMAYKGMQDILDNIGPTAEVKKMIRPIYNFKAGDED